jgi:hypothetical protein
MQTIDMPCADKFQRLISEELLVTPDLGHCHWFFLGRCPHQEAVVVTVAPLLYPQRITTTATTKRAAPAITTPAALVGDELITEVNEPSELIVGPSHAITRSNNGTHLLEEIALSQERPRRPTC